MHTKSKGGIAEMYVAAALAEKGWKVLLPFGENHRFDLAAYNNGKFIRIQVKYVTPKNGKLEVRCASSNNWAILNYTPEEIDAIAAFNPVSKEVYFIPVSEINHSAFSLRITPAKNNQKQNIHNAGDYKDFNIKLANFIKEEYKEYVTG